MDADTVIAVGSLVHDLLGLVGGIILCYFGYRLMMRRIKAYPADGKWNWRTAKILFKNTAPGTIFALFGAGAIWLTAAKGLHSDGSRSFVDHSLPSDLVTSTASDYHPLVMTLGAGAPGTFRDSQGSFPTSGPATAVAANPKIASAKRSGDVAVTSNLEKQRLAAERKRSRLEAMYEKGTISSEAYKSGENEYRIAIQRYRNEMNGTRVDEK